MRRNWNPEYSARGFRPAGGAGLPWLGSLAVHGLAAVLISAVANLASWVNYDPVDSSSYMDPLRLRTPFYFIPDKLPPALVRKAQARSAAAPAPRPRAVVPDPAPPDPPKLVFHRPFELPPAPAPRPKAPVILQPEIRIKAARLEAPALAFWARQNDIPKPDRKQFVVPGRVEGPAAPPKLTAPPVLKIPNREARLSDINVAFSNPSPLPPALPVAPSATSPVRTEEGADSLAAALDALAGQAGVNVLSLAPALPSQETLTVPAGLVNAPRAEQRAPGAGEAARSTPVRASVSVPSATGDGAGSARVAAAALPPIRIEHPANGKFDAVLMQAAARDDLVAAGAILSGNPVYTVYLRVGDRKEWILEFCAPSAPKPAPNPYQVFVEAPVVLTPPYPLLTVVPGGIADMPRPKYAVIHGFLTAAGAFRGVAASDSTDPLALAVLPSLELWHFRPATKDRQPVEVEVLLVIPPES